MIKLAITVNVKKINSKDFKTTGEYKEASASNIESALRKLKKEMQKDNIIKTYREHQVYTKPGDKKRAEIKAAKRKALRKERKQRKYY